MLGEKVEVLETGVQVGHLAQVADLAEERMFKLGFARWF
jgi:hypothetical protein